MTEEASCFRPARKDGLERECGLSPGPGYTPRETGEQLGWLHGLEEPQILSPGRNKGPGSDQVVSEEWGGARGQA